MNQSHWSVFSTTRKNTRGGGENENCETEQVFYYEATFQIHLAICLTFTFIHSISTLCLGVQATQLIHEGFFLTMWAVGSNSGLRALRQVLLSIELFCQLPCLM